MTTAEDIFNLAQDRTEWLKQFSNHEEYLANLSQFVGLYTIARYKQTKDWGALNNTKVKLDDNGQIIEAIRF